MAVADMITSRRNAKECGVLDHIGSKVEGGEILVDQQLQKSEWNASNRPQIEKSPKLQEP
jgi:hypothetical protein